MCYCRPSVTTCHGVRKMCVTRGVLNFILGEKLLHCVTTDHQEVVMYTTFMDAVAGPAKNTFYSSRFLCTSCNALCISWGLTIHQSQQRDRNTYMIGEVRQLLGQLLVHRYHDEEADLRQVRNGHCFNTVRHQAWPKHHQDLNLWKIRILYNTNGNIGGAWRQSDDLHLRELERHARFA